MNHHRSSVRLLVIVFALLLAACGAPASPAATTAPVSNTPFATSPGAIVPSSTAAPTPTIAATAKRGGTVVVGVTADPGQLNPGLTTASGTHAVADNMFNGLLQFNDKLEPQPSLAESWTVSTDGKTYTFNLAKGVTWHDGKPFSSADVKFTFEQILLKFSSRTKAALTPVLAGIDAPDPNTAVFRFKTPYAAFLALIDKVNAPIMPKHLYEGTDPMTNPANQHPVGTGPFKLDQAFLLPDPLVAANDPRPTLRLVVRRVVARIAHPRPPLLGLHPPLDLLTRGRGGLLPSALTPNAPALALACGEGDPPRCAELALLQLLRLQRGSAFGVYGADLGALGPHSLPEPPPPPPAPPCPSRTSAPARPPRPSTPLTAPTAGSRQIPVAHASLTCETHALAVT